MLKHSAVPILVVGSMCACAAAGALAQPGPGAKDIVLASLAPEARPAAGQARPDTLAVSVLVDGPYGVLLQRPADASFSDGDRFRIKVLAPRDGDILVFNTTPAGRTGATPIWKAGAKGGVELVSEPMQVTGAAGDDLLHVVLQPRSAVTNLFAWFQELLAGGKNGKDIRLVTENTQQTTYVYNPDGQGGLVTIRIRH
ncbi:hypothetical protein [Massilia yuzhufengensis]|uniref:Uncharacterized protein n=1 Tax=Massilia yuzhufengensis TaxID=1164594 RepID=A0A1I1ED29_9BURK|nr:hypothetical protein [Massilia yuzhufengensis]SFB83248.1 hypothetical protein SAMN05216204_10226 [Massilia yuzhufengensis]